MMIQVVPTLSSLAAALQARRTTSRALVEECLARIEEPGGEGPRVFTKVDRERALEAAQAMDLLRRRGSEPSPFAGIPVAIKDLFDVAGEVTTAGSRILLDSPPAVADATSVARLRRAGFVLLGRTNMTEFAYSGLGLNPHYGTPRCIFDRAQGRAPGGSTSGGAVAVAEGMAPLALGTDTGGSCRIPAAFNGLVGWKPTARRIPRDGVVPLSTSLDSVGVIGRTVSCCASADAILAADEPALITLAERPTGLRLLVPANVAFEDVHEAVGEAFDRATAVLERRGMRVVRSTLAEFEQVQSMNRLGGFSAAESYAWHRSLIERQAHLYDPRVLSRIERGRARSACDYLELLSARQSLIMRISERLASFDALLMPTVAILPPRLTDLQSDADYARINTLVLRNTSLINMIDGCAISLPLAGAGGAPVGLMLAAPGGHDRRLLIIAAEIERLLAKP
jgi:aspartyl-tRNA(Asn)/glutamyl-tRNA(Gln) amidotransferase subunit A